MKRMKTIVSLVLALTLVFCLAACGSKKADEPAAEGGDKKTFTVGFDAEFPPYGYKDDSGEYVGFDLDLAQAVCDYYGWELVKQPINWDSKDMELNSGTIDCIWNGFTMTGRESEYTWTDPTSTTARSSWSGLTPASPISPVWPARWWTYRRTPPPWPP